MSEDYDIFHFAHIASYYWHLYISRYEGTYRKNCNGQNFVAYKELSSPLDDEE